MDLHFDHLSLHVSDVEASSHFYGMVLMLKRLERPAFTFPGAWFALGNGLQLHLIGGKDYETRSSNRGNHLAFKVPDVMAMESHLRLHNVEIVTNKIRVDGVRQLFATDPDGYFVEFNEA